MEEARNSDFCGTNGGGASDLAVVVDSEVVGSVNDLLAISEITGK